MESKLTHLKEWLAANPGKTERDWLLEVRCIDDTQRQKLTEILEVCDRKGVDYVICYPVKGHYSKALFTPIEVFYDEDYYGDAIHFDIAIQKPDGVRYVFDMDAPEDIYADYNHNRPWEAALKYLYWKIPGSKEIGTPEYERATEIYKDDTLYFHDDFIDWRSPEFYYYLKA